MKEKIYNIFLRGSATLIKLIFVLFLGSILSESSFGLYNLIISSVYISLILIGFDIYLDSNRNIVKQDNIDEQNYIINNQIAAYIPLYIFFCFAIFFIPERIIPKEFLFLFFSISITEHLNSEIFRLLLALQKSIIANFLFFIRHALWPLIIIILFYFNFKFTISTLLIFWLFSSFFALLIGIIILSKKYSLSFKLIDREKIKKSYKYAFIFFVGTIAYKIVEFSDRYFIDYYLNKESVGVYSLYSQFGNVLNVIIFTVVISIGYPKLLKAIYSNEKQKIVKEKNMMLIETIFISICTILAGFFLLDYILQIINKPLYNEYNYLFYFIIAANVLFNISYIYHFIMIGYKKDFQITLFTIVGAIINIILNILLIPELGIVGAVYSKIIAFMFILISKYIFQYNLIKTQFDQIND